MLRPGLCYRGEFALYVVYQFAVEHGVAAGALRRAPKYFLVGLLRAGGGRGLRFAQEGFLDGLRLRQRLIRGAHRDARIERG